MAADGIVWNGEMEGLTRAALEERFNRLLAENVAALGRLASGYTRTAADRDDLVQEVAVALWQALPRFRGECSERTFLFRIAHNRAIAHSMRFRSTASLSDDTHEPIDPAPGPEAGLAREEESERLARAIRQLPITYRQIVILALEGLSYARSPRFSASARETSARG